MRRQLRSSDNLCEVIIRAVADQTDQDPLDLSPLGKFIEVEAIDPIFTRSSETGRVRLVLLYEGCKVVIERDAVTVEPIPEA